MMTTYAWRLTAAVTLLAAYADVTHAASAPPLSLNQAVERALTTHPALKRSELAQAASRNQRDGMAQTTAWALEAEVENFAGTGAVSGLDGAETTLGFSKLVERGDKRAKRTAVGDANVNLLTIQDREIRINIAANAATAFMVALAEQRRAEVVAASRDLAESIRAQVNRRVEVGRSAEAELATAQIAVARADAALRRSAAVKAKQHQHLAAALAEDTPSFSELVGNIESLPPLVNFETLKTKLDSNPELAGLTQQQAIRSAELRLAQAGRRSDLTLGAGVRQLAGPNDTALVFSFSMPLGQDKRSASRIDAARSRQQASPLLLKQRKLELGAELFALDADLRAAADEYRVLSREIIPVAEKAVRLYQTGFQRGHYSLFELSAAQGTLLEAQRDAINVAEQYQLLFIAQQRVLGEIPGQGVTQ